MIITVGRKVLQEDTVAENVLLHRTGGLCIDASRIGETRGQGRFPANLIFAIDLTASLPFVTCSKSKVAKPAYQNGTQVTTFLKGITTPQNQYGDRGSVMRFFKRVSG